MSDKNLDQSATPVQNTSQSSASMNSSSSKRGIIILLIFLLLLVGGSAMAYFKGWYLMLPFFQEKKEEIKKDYVESFFSNLANLHGADFEILLKTETEVLGGADTNPQTDNSIDNISNPLALIASVGSSGIEVLISGNGFSWYDADENKSMPDGRLSISGTLGALSDEDNESEFGGDFMYVDDSFFFRIINNPIPIFDFTKGHMNEWIKMSIDDEFNKYFTQVDGQKEKSFERYNRLIAEAKKRNIFTFNMRDEIVDVKGVNAQVFDVSINAKELADYIDVAREIGREYINEEEVTFVDLQKQEKTAEEKAQEIENIQEFIDNTDFYVAIDLDTSDLMMVDFSYSTTSISFNGQKTKETQSLNYKLFNHKNPTKVVAPDEYVDYEVIGRESMGMDEMQYNDYRQAEKINEIRLELANYYYENREYPKNLLDLVNDVKDINTGKDYIYTANKANYSLLYDMNTDISKLDLFLDDGNLGAGHYLTNILEGDVFVHNSLWLKGQNKADRFSPIINQYQNSSKLVNDKVADNYDDFDVLISGNQIEILTFTKAWLKNYYNEKNEYPKSLLELKKFIDAPFSSLGLIRTLGPEGFLCEDLSSGDYCDYSVSEDGQDYTIKINFKLDYADINLHQKDDSNWNYSITTGESIYFVKGENIFTSQIVIDSDRDGLNDREEEKYGTDKFNPDSDGDGYSDYEEVTNGYDPLSAPKGEDIVLSFDEDWLRGDVNAAITIVEYSDYDCPFCQKFHETMKQVLENYNGQVNWVYRHFPLVSLHPDAFKKAQAAECIAEQGTNDAFWSFSDKLYEQKPALTELGVMVEELGYNRDSWQVCMDNDKFVDKINQQTVVATAEGARGTPFSLLTSGTEKIEINGALPYETVKSYIDTALDQ